MIRPFLVCLFLLSGGAPTEVRADCGPQIQGADVFMHPGALVLFGEVHGTREIPRVFGDLACKAAEIGIPVRVGLEIPVAEKDPMSDWFNGTGAEEELWESPFFTKPYQDGRSSRAMGQLLLRLRSLRRQGKDLEPFFFDPSVRTNRDRGMAEQITNVVRKKPEAIFLILTGNLHALKTKGSPFSKTFVPMGYFLMEKGLSPLTIKFQTAKGSTWICNGGTPDSCGIRDIGGRDLGDPPILNLGEGEIPKGYDGILFVGPATASLPFYPAKGESASG